jgi:hypothetical protein
LIQRSECRKDRHSGCLTRRDHLSSLMCIICVEICGLNKCIGRIEAMCEIWFSIDIWHWESALYCKRLEICRKCCVCMVQEMKLFITWELTKIVHALLHVCCVCFVDHIEVLPLCNFEKKYVNSLDTGLSSNNGWLCDFIAVHLWLFRWLQYFKICVQVVSSNMLHNYTKLQINERVLFMVKF